MHQRKSLQIEEEWQIIGYEIQACVIILFLLLIIKHINSADEHSASSKKPAISTYTYQVIFRLILE